MLSHTFYLFTYVSTHTHTRTYMYIKYTYRSVGGGVLEMHKCVNTPQTHLQGTNLSAARKTNESEFFCSCSLLLHKNRKKERLTVD